MRCWRCERGPCMARLALLTLPPPQSPKPAKELRRALFSPPFASGPPSPPRPLETELRLPGACCGGVVGAADT
eukprot:614872-Prymnesium_polylepis.1